MGCGGGWSGIYDMSSICERAFIQRNAGKSHVTVIAITWQVLLWYIQYKKH